MTHDDTTHDDAATTDAQHTTDSDYAAANLDTTHVTKVDGGTVALAFSGGLDTTVCVPLLEDLYGYDEVVGVTVDVGQPAEEFAEAEETAAALDLEHYVVDAKDEFADLCFESVTANATYQGYPLGTALARPVIAEAIAEVAADVGADAVAHGCTGKGNDQLRFEAVWRDTDLDVVAPVRELGLTREFEQAYAAELDLPVEGGNEGDWSIDTNLWSRSVEGKDLEDPAYVPPEEIYDWTTEPGTVTEPTLVQVGFADGLPTGVSVLEGPESVQETAAEAVTEAGDADEATTAVASGEPVATIEFLNALAGAYGVGRTDMMEDRMLGLKVRENYEHPAASVLHAAHEALEGLVLTKDERDFKATVDDEWSQKAYEGLVHSPLSAALGGFLDVVSEKTEGTVTVKLAAGQARAVGRDSEHAVYSESAASFDTSTVDGIEQADATGVAKYHGFQDRLANSTSTTSESEESTDETTITADD
ncbi:argininosuccinate synthase [Halorubellus sp. JP-L1]|uniref:argininosuccinate synthase n=1 Tax=Halorubellus sp. JP-L1 TaxID=2715753 RepID=UPI001407C0A9|nr:argininosuccinate synthase [Halorubellus sp. JP-L1]NHN43329.1 argininosuccinate synthase [Halorubellus sp. JP-L1]